ncbi:MAG TPA: hypothetical protein DFI01_00820 [Bacteroidales bacterium]|nr:hypothetical protein [Bacteroidales bacterium]
MNYVIFKTLNFVLSKSWYFSIISFNRKLASIYSFNRGIADEMVPRTLSILFEVNSHRSIPK